MVPIGWVLLRFLSVLLLVLWIKWPLWGATATAVAIVMWIHIRIRRRNKKPGRTYFEQAALQTAQRMYVFTNQPG